jgi:hypothetical protein
VEWVVVLAGARLIGALVDPRDHPNVLFGSAVVGWFLVVRLVFKRFTASAHHAASSTDVPSPGTEPGTTHGR